MPATMLSQPNLILSRSSNLADLKTIHALSTLHYSLIRRLGPPYRQP